ncbi:hypothetical protein AMR41_09290 [Hapalosiphon sp. MRB220]|nr:hypothetical protein AMR41_09290 [Hapalosiphon sp. MRB220]
MGAAVACVAGQWPECTGLVPRARCITEDLWLLVPALVHITGGGARAGAVHRTFGYDTGHRCLGGDHGRADDGAPAGEPVR